MHEFEFALKFQLMKGELHLLREGRSESAQVSLMFEVDQGNP